MMEARRQLNDIFKGLIKKMIVNLEFYSQQKHPSNVKEK